MKILTLPVDDSIAEGYNSADPTEKTKINSAINVLLGKFLKSNQNTALFSIMDELSEEATKNGLTIDKLGEVMEWDNDTMKNLLGETDKANAR